MITDIDIANKLIQLHRSATDRGIEFNLTFNDVKKLLNSKICFYTKVTLNEKLNDIHQRTIDRVDNEKGYITGNVVACSSTFNKLKNNLTIQDVKYLVSGFKRKKLW